MPNLHLCTFLANSCQRSMLTCIDEPWQAYLRYSSTTENIFINVHGIFKYLKYLPMKIENKTMVTMTVITFQQQHNVKY